MATESGAKIGIFQKMLGVAYCFFSGKGRMMTGLMLNTAPQAFQMCSTLEPDWLTKAAGLKLPHWGRASPAAFGRQAALRID